MKRHSLIFIAIMSVATVLAAPIPLPEALAKLPVAKDTTPVMREITPGVTYHGVEFANYTGDGPLAIHFLVIDWKHVGPQFTLTIVPGKDGNRSRPSDLAKGTNAVAAINGVFFEMKDPYVPFYVRKINGVVSKSKVAGGDGCFAFNRGEMPFIGRFSTNALARYSFLISADGVPAPRDEAEAKLTRAERQKMRAPRSFAGNNTTNRITVIAVADGRQKRSTGLTYTETQRILRAWGCDQLAHLDGGGSSVMVLKGSGLKGSWSNGPCEIMNRPSDGLRFASLGLPAAQIERPVAESLMLLDGPATSDGE